MLLELTPECRDAALGRLPAARADRPRSIRVFRQILVEKLLSQAHPITPIVWFGPVIALGLWHGLTHGVGVLAVAALFLCGWLVWSLLEYLLHRFLFHLPAHTDEARVRVFLIHGYHHEFPDDRMRLVAPPIMSWGPALIFAALFRLVAGPTAWGPLLAGAAIGYVAYDWIHYYTHHFRPRGGVGRWLRRYHMLHHHRHEDACYGVSSPLWDLVFGTYRR